MSLENRKAEFIMNREFNKEWVDWISLNIDRGCDKDGIFKILIDEGFDPIQIEEHMGYKPNVTIDSIANPLKNDVNISKNFIEALSQWLKGLFSSKKTNIAFQGVLPSTEVFIPNAERINSELIEMYLLPNFLTKDECERITKIIKSKLRPSTIASNTDEPDEKFRTSRTCDLGTIGDVFIEDIDQRICKMLGINASYSEIIQGQYYEHNQEFKSHTDYFEGDSYEEFAKKEGQRTFTFMVYLNDVEEGGETEFVKIGKKISPEQGMAVIWNNLNADGSVNPNTIHHAHPVISGYKSIITKWFRSNGEGPMYTKSESELIQNYTDVGFKKDILDKKLFNKVQQFYKNNEHKAQIEIVKDFIHKKENDEPASTLVELDANLKKEIHLHLKPILEQWSKTKLEPTFVYGIRVYGKDAVLKEHRDREKTHIVSAIINVNQNVDVEWPLVIEDHYYRKHEIVLSPGEIIIYEGAKLQHGRPQPLQGEEYANIFCHFRISGA